MDDESARRAAAITAYRQKLLQHTDMDARVRADQKTRHSLQYQYDILLQLRCRYGSVNWSVLFVSSTEVFGMRMS